MALFLETPLASKQQLSMGLPVATIDHGAGGSATPPARFLQHRTNGALVGSLNPWKLEVNFS